MILTQQQLHDALVERHGTEIQKKLDGATVGIAGLGGLGSNLAVFLARLGIGHMVLVDFDVPIVVDSDSHICFRVGHVEGALEMLEEIGFPEELIINSSMARLDAYFKGRGMDLFSGEE